MGQTMGTGNVHDDDVETLQFADEADYAEDDDQDDDEPECICYDSNLPARPDCPYCYPSVKNEVRYWHQWS